MFFCFYLKTFSAIIINNPIRYKKKYNISLRKIFQEGNTLNTSLTPQNRAPINNHNLYALHPHWLTLESAHQPHPAEYQQAAKELHTRHALAQQQKGDHRREHRLGGNDQVGHTGRQVAQAHVIQPEPRHGRTRCQQKEHPPPCPTVTQPEHVGRRGRRAGQFAAAGQVGNQHETGGEGEGIHDRHPGVQPAVGRRAPHQAVNGIRQPRQDAHNDARNVALPHRRVIRPGHQRAAAEAQHNGRQLDDAQVFL